MSEQMMKREEKAARIEQMRSRIKPGMKVSTEPSTLKTQPNEVEDQAWYEGKH
jgi:hypothetical protein